MGNSFFSNSNRGEILNKLAIASKLIMGKSLVFDDSFNDLFGCD